MGMCGYGLSLAHPCVPCKRQRKLVEKMVLFLTSVWPLGAPSKFLGRLVQRLLLRF